MREWREWRERRERREREKKEKKREEERREKREKKREKKRKKKRAKKRKKKREQNTHREKKEHRESIETSISVNCVKSRRQPAGISPPTKPLSSPTETSSSPPTKPPSTPSSHTRKLVEFLFRRVPVRMQYPVVQQEFVLFRRQSPPNLAPFLVR
jgi:hypothetical protein